jgi:hypothetical protein
MFNEELRMENRLIDGFAFTLIIFVVHARRGGGAATRQSVGRASIRARANLFAGHEFHRYGGYRIRH